MTLLCLEARHWITSDRITYGLSPSKYLSEKPPHETLSSGARGNFRSCDIMRNNSTQNSWVHTACGVLFQTISANRQGNGRDKKSPCASPVCTHLVIGHKLSPLGTACPRVSLVSCRQTRKDERSRPCSPQVLRLADANQWNHATLGTV